MDFYKEKNGDEVYAVVDERTWVTLSIVVGKSGAAKCVFELHRLPIGQKANVENDVPITEADFYAFLIGFQDFANKQFAEIATYFNWIS